MSANLENSAVAAAAAAKSLQSCPTVQPRRLQPTRLRHPWDSPGKNTGVGCHFLLQCMKVKSENEVAQSCVNLSDPMDCSLPGSSVHGSFQARVLEWVAIFFSIKHTKSIQRDYKGNKDDAVEVLYSIRQQIWKTQSWPQDWKRSVFIPIQKKGNAKDAIQLPTFHKLAR